jgi:hypothetical protein
MAALLPIAVKSMSVYGTGFAMDVDADGDAGLAARACGIRGVCGMRTGGWRL